MADRNGDPKRTPETLTSNFGAPIADNQNTLTAGNPGPALIADYHLIEKNAHFNRERVPERVVHAKGAGAFGYFEVTDDVAQYTRAAFLSQIGKRTELVARFSTVAGEKGASDVERDPRGFAVKFYTEEGNYDLVGNNTPIFFIRDPLKFPDFIHSQKRLPQNNLRSKAMQWDFWSLSPESLHQVTYLMGDRGIPAAFQNMNGYGSHTYQWINREGKTVWVKYHFKAELGVKNLTRQKAAEIQGHDPDHHTRSLYDLIAGGDVAAWKLYVQIMAHEEAFAYKWDPFDVTKVWSHKDYPLVPVGRMVLNKNPENYFADIEQGAWEPSNVVPGIWFSPDKMLQGRIFAYADAHRYRIGPNYALLPTNRPRHAAVHNYQRDGNMRFDANGGSAPVYEPNSLGGPAQDKAYEEPPYAMHGATTGRYDQKTPRNDDYQQPGDLYRLMSNEEKARLVDTLVDHMGDIPKETQTRQIGHFAKADGDLGARLAAG
ncbi:MAG: catalase, partial [Candidatus Baltobacteraceae bacterium]